MDEQHAHPWLVMLYFAGANDLGEPMVLALQEIADQGVPHGDRVVAQLRTRSLKDAHRYRFTSSRGMELDACEEPKLAPAADTGAPETLTNFIEWAFEGCGTRPFNSLLVLSGHGSGVTEDRLLKDEITHASMKVSDLRSALTAATLSTGRRINVIGLDSCYMNMCEVAYEIRDHADIMVGSEGLVPSTGWPYRRLFDLWTNARRSGKNLTSESLAESIVTEYIRHYAVFDRALGRSVDAGAFRLGHIHAVAAGIQRLSERLKTLSTAEHRQVLIAHWFAQTFKSDQFVDLRDFCVQLRDVFDGSPNIATACTAVLAAVDAGTIRSGVSGPTTQYSYGLSLYFPWSVLAAPYSELAFSTATGWQEFLTLHLKATRRRSRFEASPRQVDAVVDSRL